MYLNLLLLVAAFAAMWVGAGFVISSVEKVSKKLHLSAFTVSFFVLGFLTSLPEFALGINSIILGKPQVFAGNLIGGILVLFLLLIPFLAIVGDGVYLSHDLGNKKIFLVFLVVLAPALLVLDSRINLNEAGIIIVLYLVLVFFLSKRKSILESFKHRARKRTKANVNLYKEVLTMVVGAAIIFVASNYIVKETIEYAQVLHMSEFVFGLIFLSVGTNIPEITLALKAVLKGKKDIALGEYLGSATANSLALGILTLMYGSTYEVKNSPMVIFAFMVLTLALFYWFSRSRNNISRKEGVIMFVVYLVFLTSELAS